MYKKILPKEAQRCHWLPIEVQLKTSKYRNVVWHKHQKRYFYRFKCIHESKNIVSQNIITINDFFVNIIL